MSEQRDKAFVQHSIDTGLESMQGNPFLAQRIMNQERTEQPVMKKKISFAFILAMILVILSIATAVAGAVNEDFNAWLYRIWPEAAMKLMPVNMSCVNQGIRMEVISAVAEGSDVLVTYAMEDLEGNRIDENTEVNIEAEYTECTSSCAEVASPLYDPEEKKIIGSSMISFESDINPADWEIGIYTNCLMQCTHSTVNLLPLLQEYGSQAKSAAVPEQAVVFGGYQGSGFMICYGDFEEKWDIPDSMHVLDWQNGLDIPLADEVSLSGIGFVDGLLHVQLHYKVPNVVETQYMGHYGEGTLSYSPYEIWPVLCDADEEEELYASNKYCSADMLPGGISHMSWESDSAPGESWKEVIFAMDSEPTDAQSFFADITVQNAITGDWYINVPLRMIQHAE